MHPDRARGNPDAAAQGCQQEGVTPAIAGALIVGSARGDSPWNRSPDVLCDPRAQAVRGLPGIARAFGDLAGSCAEHRIVRLDEVARPEILTQARVVPGSGRKGRSVLSVVSRVLNSKTPSTALSFTVPVKRCPGTLSDSGVKRRPEGAAEARTFMKEISRTFSVSSGIFAGHECVSNCP
jgi:hypothetical protein